MWGRLSLLACAAALSGCGFFKGITNPGSAWALGESAPMSLVIRRAEVAAGIADEVERLVAATPIDEASEEALKLTQAEATTLLEHASTDAVYIGPEPYRIVPAEAWLPKLSAACAESGDAQTLIGMLGSEVASAYADVAAQDKKIAALKGEIATLEEQDKPDETKIAALEGRVAELEEGHAAKVDALVASMKKAAAAAAPDDNARMAPIVANLLEAVGDARDANSAAMMRYPLALPGLSSDLQQAATRFVADVIEEKSGHRPTTGGISPTITLDGFDVKLSLNGVPDEALGTLSASDVIGEVSARTQRYATRTATLLGDTSQTEDRLAFLERMLEAWRDGLGASAGVDISDLEVASKPAPGATPSATAPAASAGSKTSAAVRSLGGLAIRHCSGASAVTIAKNETPADAQPKAKQAPKQAPKQPTAQKPRAHEPATGQATGTKWIDLPGGGPEVMDGPAQH